MPCTSKLGGRPRGECRLLLATAVEALTLERGGATWYELAVATQVGYTTAKNTVSNMLRSGELRVADKRLVHGQWTNFVAPALRESAPAPGAHLSNIMLTWPVRTPAPHP